MFVKTASNAAAMKRIEVTNATICTAFRFILRLSLQHMFGK